MVLLTFIVEIHVNEMNYTLPQMNFKNMDTTYNSELRFLGIYITKNLKWYTLVQLLRPKLNKVFHIIKSLNEVMSPFMI
jgi:hypothetical protein